MKAGKAAVLIVLIALVAVFAAGMVFADDKIAVKGKIKSFDIDDRTLTVTIDGGEVMQFVVKDDMALGKLGDRLFEGDEVKIKYVIEQGKKVIKESGDLRGTKAGC